MPTFRPLTAAQREDAADAMLLLANTRASLATVIQLGVQDPDGAQALANARAQLSQVAATLGRLSA